MSTRGISVGAALQAARSLGVPALDAQVLLSGVVGQSRAWLIAHAEDLLSERQQGVWNQWLSRRASGEPVAYVLGVKEFYGLELQVSSDVLVPRPDTEILVDWALQCLTGLPTARVLDLGTGSGAIALAIKSRCPAAEVTAVEASPRALQVAQSNAQRLGLAVNWVLNDLDRLQGRDRWWPVLGQARFDLVVSNPPYVAAGDAHLQDLRFEPQAALVGGPSGLEDLEQIVAGAREHLTPGGWMLLEHGFDQADAVQADLRRAGLSDIQSRADLSGHRRCSGGRLTVG